MNSNQNENIVRTISLRKKQINELKKVCTKYDLKQRDAVDEIFHLGIIAQKYYRELGFKSYDQFDQYLFRVLPKDRTQLILNQRLRCVHEFINKLKETEMDERVLGNIEILLENTIMDLERNSEILKQALLLFE